MLKKKITKQSLEQLAKEMPTLHEYEMSQMIGGVMFVVSGSVGRVSVGTSDELRFVNSSKEYEDLLASSVSPDTKENIALGIGTSWSASSEDDKLRFVASLLSENCPNISKLMANGGTIGFGGNVIAGVSVEDKTLLISNSSSLSTYSNLLYVLSHEDGHISGNNASGTTGFIELSEPHAITASESSPYFKTISYSMRVEHLKAKIRHQGYSPSRDSVSNLFGVSTDEADMIMNAAMNSY